MKAIILKSLILLGFATQICAQELSDRQWEILYQTVQIFDDRYDSENAARTMDKMNKERTNKEADFYFKYGKHLLLASRDAEAKAQFQKYKAKAIPCRFCKDADYFITVIERGLKGEHFVWEMEIVVKGETLILEFEENPYAEKVSEDVFENSKIDEKPIFPGGEPALMKYVSEHTKYPVVALENGIEGIVFIRFVITRTGDVGEANVLRAVDPLLEEEALRVVRTLPKWTPGKLKGKPVNVWFIIPVKFTLE